MATIRTVAARAGVSIKTVSRVMNEPGSVAAETRERVLAAAAELNFVPDQRARAMRSGRSGVVGFLSDVIATTPYSVDIVRGVEDALAEHGMSLLIGNTENRPDDLPHIMRSFRASRVEGVVFATMFHRRADEFSARDNLPAVLVNCFADAGSVPTVLPDDEAGGYAVGRHLLSLGHRRIAYLTLPPDAEATKLRHAGLARAFAEAGETFPADLIVIGQQGSPDFDPSFAYEVAARLLSRAERPTAIFCGNDEMALQVYNAAAALGIRIPDELSVVGYDDYHLFSLGLRPALTTVVLPYRRMGEIAAELLIKRIKDDAAKAETIRVEGPLVARASTAVPVKAARRA
jgi:LacI family transcriptional regulator, galactose operon repressor